MTIPRPHVLLATTLLAVIVFLVAGLLAQAIGIGWNRPLGEWIILIIHVMVMGWVWAIIWERRQGQPKDFSISSDLSESE
jgi:uncharacterized RDD family membrane protein YckC